MATNKRPLIILYGLRTTLYSVIAERGEPARQINDELCRKIYAQVNKSRCGKSSNVPQYRNLLPSRREEALEKVSARYVIAGRDTECLKYS